LFFIRNQNFIPKNNREHFLKKIEKVKTFSQEKIKKKHFFGKNKDFFSE
jgi:hypothetical protein